MISTESRRGRAALMVAHCAGMVDLVALPVWVGTLMAAYGFDPQQAGGLVTLFLAGAVAASLVLAWRFHRLPARRLAAPAFAMAAACFGGAALTSDFAILAMLHAVGGASAGAALSVTHGTVGRSANPHRLFAVVGLALGVFAVLFMAGVPQLVIAFGGAALFVVFAAVMLAAALVTGAWFPQAQGAATEPVAIATVDALPKAVWFGILGVSCMALVQAMVFSFLERMGVARGFGQQPVNVLLIVIGLVNLLPAALAALLQARLGAARVVLAGACVQALLAATIAGSSGFMPYAAAASIFVAVMIFTHTFAFGWLAALDPSGRAVAATPAMLMVGSAIGPILGGTLAKVTGYGALAAAAVSVDALALVLFALVSASAGNAARGRRCADPARTNVLIGAEGERQ